MNHLPLVSHVVLTQVEVQLRVLQVVLDEPPDISNYRETHNTTTLDPSVVVRLNQSLADGNRRGAGWDPRPPCPRARQRSNTRTRLQGPEESLKDVAVWELDPEDHLENRRDSLIRRYSLIRRDTV